jgi:hypothetical protein
LAEVSLQSNFEPIYLFRREDFDERSRDRRFGCGPNLAHGFGPDSFHDHGAETIQLFT